MVWNDRNGIIEFNNTNIHEVSKFYLLKNEADYPNLKYYFIYFSGYLKYDDKTSFFILSFLMLASIESPCQKLVNEIYCCIN